MAVPLAARTRAGAGQARLRQLDQAGHPQSLGDLPPFGDHGGGAGAIGWLPALQESAAEFVKGPRQMGTGIQPPQASHGVIEMKDRRFPPSEPRRQQRQQAHHRSLPLYLGHPQHHIVIRRGSSSR